MRLPMLAAAALLCLSVPAEAQRLTECTRFFAIGPVTSWLDRDPSNSSQTTRYLMEVQNRYNAAGEIKILVRPGTNFAPNTQEGQWLIYWPGQKRLVEVGRSYNDGPLLDTPRVRDLISIECRRH